MLFRRRSGDLSRAEIDVLLAYIKRVKKLDRIFIRRSTDVSSVDSDEDQSHYRLLAVVAFIVPVVSAAGIGNENDGVAGLLSQADGYGTREYFTITQGETDTHLLNVPAGMSLLNVDLNWFTPDHSLELEIYRPDGGLYLEYQDYSINCITDDNEFTFAIPAGASVVYA